MDNGIARLAYEAALRATEDQAAVLDGLRTRAGTVFAAAALVSSFLGGQALSGYSHLHVWSLPTAALTAFVASAVFTLAILWPFSFGFSVSPSATLEAVELHESTIAELYRVLAVQIEWYYESNRAKIRGLLWALEAVSSRSLLRSPFGSSFCGGRNGQAR